jgi:hypothetical protein
MLWRLIGRSRRWLQASLAAGMDSLPVVSQELRPNHGFQYRQIRSHGLKLFQAILAAMQKYRILNLVHIYRLRGAQIWC